MIEIVNNEITMTRGDTLITTVEFTADNEPYTPIATDDIKFFLKRSKLTADKGAYVDKTPLLTINIPYDTLQLRIESADTKPFRFGTYDYNVQITHINGDVQTYIKSTLTLTPEVD